MHFSPQYSRTPGRESSFACVRHRMHLRTRFVPPAGMRQASHAMCSRTCIMLFSRLWGWFVFVILPSYVMFCQRKIVIFYKNKAEDADWFPFLPYLLLLG